MRRRGPGSGRSLHALSSLISLTVSGLPGLYVVRVSQGGRGQYCVFKLYDGGNSVGSNEEEDMSMSTFGASG